MVAARRGRGLAGEPTSVGGVGEEADAGAADGAELGFGGELPLLLGGGGHGGGTVLALGVVEWTRRKQVVVSDECDGVMGCS